MIATVAAFLVIVVGLAEVAAQEPLTIYPSGSAGIGTWTQPAERLKVEGDVTATGRFRDETGFVTPVGAILPYGGGNAPAGWLLCNGNPVSRTAYAALYAAIGTAFGDGDGSATFNVPDFRGRFLRGVDGGAGRDPDRLARRDMETGLIAVGDVVGSVQDSAFQGHWHATTFGYADQPGGTSSGYRAASGSDNTKVKGAISDGVHGPVNPTSETRPTNAYVNFIIKY